MATYLVTGAAGFIGSNLCRSLVASGATVRGVDDFSTGKRANLDGLRSLELFEGDINDGALLDRAMRGVDFVLHQAAIPSVPRSIDDPTASHVANVDGTLCVLEAARRARVRRVVYAASSSAYGDTPTLPKVETMPPRPLSPYAVQKLTGELYCQVYTHVFSLQCVALRYFNVFGPYQDPQSRYAAVIPKFIQCALRGEPPPVFGDGRQTRDFTFIDNVVEANLKACTAERAAGLVINVACADRITLLDVIAAINELLGTHVAPRLMPARPGDIRDSFADITLAKDVLGYSASVGFREGLRRTLEWYQAGSTPT